MTTATPADAAMQLRSEQRERLHNAVEALVMRLAPTLEKLETDSMAALLAVELVRVVEGVQDEHMHRLAELV